MHTDHNPVCLSGLNCCVRGIWYNYCRLILKSASNRQFIIAEIPKCVFFFLADNEAGGEDALVGNVNKLMVTPPGYTGLPKKGHIIFDACFESGERSEYLYFLPPFSRCYVEHYCSRTAFI